MVKKNTIKKKAVYVKLVHPSGRISTQKLMSKSKNLKTIRRKYLGSAEHFRTEAIPVAIVAKLKKKKGVGRRRSLWDLF